MNKTNDRTVLEEFLCVPLGTTDDIFSRFAALPNAVYERGAGERERFCYVPGTRKDRVILAAHADTIWSYNGKENVHDIKFENGLFTSATEGLGLGADDRAGCSIVWILRESGHSLLIFDSEERDRQGCELLKKNSKILKEVQKHRYMLELDMWGSSEFKPFCANLKSFAKYISLHTGFSANLNGGNTDITRLCSRVCGANFSVGYAHYHRPDETLDYVQWQQSLTALRKLLSQKQPRFTWKRTILYYFFGALRRIKRLIIRKKPARA